MLKRPWRIGLRPFLCIIACICVSLGFIARPIRDRQLVFRAIEHEGGSVYSVGMLNAMDEPSRIPSHLAHFLGLTPASIEFRDRSISSVAALKMAQLGVIEELSYLPTSRPDWAPLSHLRNINTLYIRHADDQVCESLQQLEGLKRLSLRGRTLTGSEFGRLAHFDRLKSLSLNYTGVTDQAMEYISEITSLEELYLTGTAVSDRGVAKLQALSKLRVLYLNETDLSSACLEPLAKLTGLVELHIDSIGFNYDNSADLRVLGRLRNLQMLEIYKLVVDGEGRPEIKEVLPRCKFTASYTSSREYMNKFPITEEMLQELSRSVDEAIERGESPFSVF